VGPTALPLIIIDGVRSKASFDDIAALELESFEIVKGSEAVADYGEDGRNGAILIFTKRSDGDGKDGGTS
jgi:outer membrane cobalamin receptor